MENEMRVTSLEIKRNASYASERANELVGIVTLTSDQGQTTVALSPGGIARIFGIIASEVQETARRNAQAVSGGLQDAQDEQSLLTHEIPSF
jgi:hypothetical protein